MHLITAALSTYPDSLPQITIAVDRHKLARRRWRGLAQDGQDFGFDLIEPLQHGDPVFVSEQAVYCIEQLPEPCLRLPLAVAHEAAWLGWMVGNLHFKAAFSSEGILVQDDLAVRQMLQREAIAYAPVQQIFEPSKQGGHTHDHSHRHA